MKKYIFTASFVLIFAIYSFIIFAADVTTSKNQMNTIPGIVVVKLKPGFNIDKLTNTIQSFPAQKISQIFPHHSAFSTLSRLYYIYFDASYPPEEMATKLSEWDMFEYVEPKYLSYVNATMPNDSLLAQQFHLAQINIFAGWDIDQGAANIVLAIVDNGTEYQHPDLFANIWSNAAEAQGMAGVDDDNNGFIDDIYGWDFGENDNDPNYGSDESNITSHGTHTAGIASAVTNNIAGIAGIGWNCSILPIKVSTNEDANAIPFGYEGIIYAADQGAQVINNSWGRSGAYSQYEQDIINYAVSKGSIVVAAAGNSNNDLPFYPAGYVHVLAVASVNENDQKASYSNYGKYVDISAPGGDLNAKIFSTFPVARGEYGMMSGTSMASPVVAGVMGLLLNQFPDFNQLQLFRQIILTADRVDDLNEDYRGLIGWGRVNGFRALTEDVQEEELAKIDLFKAAVNDSVWGNGNSLFERNETIGVNIWYRNYSVSPGRNLTIRLLTDDNDLIMTRSWTTVNHVPPDSVFAVRDQLNFKIRAQAKSHLAKLILNYSLDNGLGGSDTIYTIVGKSSVLFVDDDNGIRNVEGYYTSVLDRLNIPYLRWDHALLGTPSAQTVSYFPLVIWSCEWAFPNLSAEDRVVLQHYLNQNGNLFISGQDIGWELADPGSQRYSDNSARFYQDYLHSIYQADYSGSQTVVGMPGTFSQGMTFDIYQPKIAFRFQYPEWIEPAPQAVLTFQYDNGKGAGTSFSGNHKVLNLGFGFEAVDARQDEDPNRPSRHRTELMQRILNQLGPIQHQPLLDQENITDSLSFEITLAPQVDDLLSLMLFWKTDTMSDFSELRMRPVGDRTFHLAVDLKSYTGQVQYYFELTTPYYRFNLPVTAEDEPFTFHIGEDVIPPRFYHIQLKDIFVQNRNREVEVVVEDNVGVDSSSVWFHYRTPLDQDSSLMIFKGNQRYESSIPPIIEFGDSISYYFTARDRARQPNSAVSPLFNYKIGVEGFEYGMDFWIADSNSWTIDNQDYHSGTFCISSTPGQYYDNNLDVCLNSKFGIRRNRLKDMILSLWTEYELEENRDSGLVEISLNDGKSWQPIGEPITGKADNWSQKFYDLGAFYDMTDDTLLLRFRLRTDSSQTEQMSGWFIDDIAIQSKASLKIHQTNQITHSLANVDIYSISPNPFNASTRISYQLSIAGDTSFEIYNLLGQLVFKRLIGFQQAGQYDLLWNGTDMKGQSCGSGIYFGRLILKASQLKTQKQISKAIKMIIVE